MDVLLPILGILGGLMLVAAIVYCWRNRPYRGAGDEWRDEAAMEASKFANRSGTGGL